MNAIPVKRSRAIVSAALIATAVAVLGAITTQLGPWYYSLRMPAWKPPDWLFGPAWTLIFGLAAVSGYIGWTRSAGRTALQARILAAFAANGVCNILWSALFFGMRRPDWALAEVGVLWLSIVVLMILLSRISAIASALLAPYLVWVSFAAVLNLEVVRLNGPFS